MQLYVLRACEVLRNSESVSAVCVRDRRAVQPVRQPLCVLHGRRAHGFAMSKGTFPTPSFIVTRALLHSYMLSFPFASYAILFFHMRRRFYFPANFPCVLPDNVTF